MSEFAKIEQAMSRIADFAYSGGSPVSKEDAQLAEQAMSEQLRTLYECRQIRSAPTQHDDMRIEREYQEMIKRKLSWADTDR